MHTEKMRIALLNLPLDSNFGGNLQRYALITFLKKLGYNIEHINLRINYQLPWYKIPFAYTKRIFLKVFRNDKRPIFLEKHLKETDYQKIQAIDTFYKKYIPHTNAITKKTELHKLASYDAYIVGSDQVWRKRMTCQLGLNTYFLDFVKNQNAIKIAYSVSLGNSNNELTPKNIKHLRNLYKQFKAVSVREDSALELFQHYQWMTPQAIHTVDPTFLLSKEDYIKLINAGNTISPDGDLFCYILDQNDEKEKVIQETAQKLDLKPFYITINENISIEQWLRAFHDSKYVITDSYHGLVFSIIFNKPFLLLENEKRGNARFESILKMFNLKANSEKYDWNYINLTIKKEQERSIIFLQKALSISE